MALPYLDITAFQLRADMIQPADVAALEARFPGFVAQQLLIASSYVDARLKKRYAVPFANPPEIVLGWVTTLATRACWHRRGFNAQDPAMIELKERCEAALGELKEASDSKDGLFDLPLLGDAAGDSGVISGGPLGYSEQSPYVAFDLELAQATAEDAAGRGS